MHTDSAFLRVSRNTYVLASLFPDREEWVEDVSTGTWSSDGWWWGALAGQKREAARRKCIAHAYGVGSSRWTAYPARGVLPGSLLSWSCTPSAS